MNETVFPQANPHALTSAERIHNESHRPLFDEVYAALTQPTRSTR